MYDLEYDDNTLGRAKHDSTVLSKLTDTSLDHPFDRSSLAGSVSKERNNDKLSILIVCSILRAHIIAALFLNEAVDTETHIYDVFQDTNYLKVGASTEDSDKFAKMHSQDNAKDFVNGQELKNDKFMIPELGKVIDFFSDIYFKSQMDSENITMTLLYCERLVRTTGGKLRLRNDNWMSILFSCMILASKVWDDLSMSNIDFSRMRKEFCLGRLNELELATVKALHFELLIVPTEFAKYNVEIQSVIHCLGMEKYNSMLEPQEVLSSIDLEQAFKNYYEQKVKTFSEMQIVRSTDVEGTSPYYVSSSDSGAICNDRGI